MGATPTDYAFSSKLNYKEVKWADQSHVRPDGVGDATVAAVGKVSEALEWVERARGRLYDLHQMIGRADLLMGEAVEALQAAGHAEEARMLEREIVGRNVLHGRWTFQVVEEFNQTYYQPVLAAEEQIRVQLMAGRRHVFESEMKERRRTHGMPGHESRPSDEA